MIGAEHLTGPIKLEVGRYLQSKISAISIIDMDILYYSTIFLIVVLLLLIVDVFQLI